VAKKGFFRHGRNALKKIAIEKDQQLLNYAYLARLFLAGCSSAEPASALSGIIKL